MHQHMLGAVQLDSILAENNLGPLLDTKLNIATKVPLPQKKANGIES